MALKDKEMASRIAELLSEKEEAEDSILAMKQKSLHELNKALDDANNEIEANKEQFQSEIETLDKLYLCKVEALAARVQQLESSSSNCDLHTNRSNNSGGPYSGRNSANSVGVEAPSFKTSQFKMPSLPVTQSRNVSARTAAHSILSRGTTNNNNFSKKGRNNGWS
jgi:hypothetical protein